MKVRELIKNLTEFDMDADVLVSTGNTFDDVSDFSLSWGGPDSDDGETKDMAKFVYINLNGENKEQTIHNDMLIVKVSAYVRYWEDSEINGADDDQGNPKMPCVQNITGIYDRNVRKYWCPLIDVETGRIINWEKGVEASIHYKVCDECGLIIMKGDNVLYDDEDYVPGFLCPKEEGYGDYIIMDIDSEGFIKDWRNTDVTEFLNEVKNNS